MFPVIKAFLWFCCALFWFFHLKLWSKNNEIFGKGNPIPARIGRGWSDLLECDEAVFSSWTGDWTGDHHQKSWAALQQKSCYIPSDLMCNDDSVKLTFHLLPQVRDWWGHQAPERGISTCCICSRQHSAGKTKWLKINGKILLFLIVSWKM